MTTFLLWLALTVLAVAACALTYTPPQTTTDEETSHGRRPERP